MRCVCAGCLDGQVDIVVDFPREVYEFARLVAHLASLLY